MRKHFKYIHKVRHYKRKGKFDLDLTTFSRIGVILLDLVKNTNFNFSPITIVPLRKSFENNTLSQRP
jgi:hypothetical protein